jgi:hypothetical protein
MNKPYNIQNTNILILIFPQLTVLMNPGRFARNPVRSVSRFAPIPVCPALFRPVSLSPSFKK